MTESADPQPETPPPAPAPAAAAPNQVRNRWIAFGLIALTLVVYRPVGRFSFINYDDPKYVGENPDVVGGLTWQNFKQSFVSIQGGYRHPVTWWTHLLDISLYGDDAGGHHVTNLIIHTANSVLIWWVLLRLTGAVWPAVWTAAIFAVHPAHLESVAWVSERKDVLSTLFLLLTVWAYARYGERPSAARYGLVALAFIGALMSKPMMVTIPGVLLILDLWPLRRIRIDATFWPALGRRALEKVPLLLLSGVSAWITMADVAANNSLMSTNVIPLSTRLATSIVSYARYLGKLFWPTKLAIFYPFPPGGWPVAWIVGSTVLFLAITAITLWQARRRPWLLVGWLWFVGMLVPVIGLVITGDASLADRYTYAPSIGLSMAVALVARELAARFKARKLCAAVGVLTVVACAVVSARGVWYWRDTRSVMVHAMEVTDHNWTAMTNYGAILVEEGRADEAEPYFREAYKLKPEANLIALNMARWYIEQGALDKAKPLILQAHDTNSKDADVYTVAGRYFARAGYPNEAIVKFDEALRLKPKAQEAIVGKAQSLLTLNRIDEALPLLAHAKPVPLIQHQLGLIAIKQNRPNDAIELFQSALAKQPGLGIVHLDYGILLANMGRLDDALPELQRALDTLPSHRPAGRSLAEISIGKILERQGQQMEAAKHYVKGIEWGERAVALDPTEPAIQYQLANTLQDVGQTDRALAVARGAMQLAIKSNHKYLIHELQARFPELATTRPTTTPATTQAAP